LNQLNQALTSAHGEDGSVDDDNEIKQNQALDTKKNWIAGKGERREKLNGGYNERERNNAEARARRKF
jgi:hypothetical protein